STGLGGTETITMQEGAIFQPLDGFSSSRPITLVGNAAILVDGSASATLAGAISGSSILGKNGTGTLILEENNTFNLLAFNAGTISISNGNQLGNGELVFNGEATLVTTQTLERGNTLRMDNGTAAGTIEVANGTTFTHSGLLLGAGNLVKTGGGIASFTNSLGFTGPINLQAGTLSSTGLGGTETITMQEGTTFQPLDGFSSSRPITLAGNAAIVVDSGASATLAGVISGSSILGKNGTGTLILGGNNTFNLLAFNAGTLSISNGNQLGNGEVVFNDAATLLTTQTLEHVLTLRMNNGTNLGTIEVANGTTFTQSGLVLGDGLLTKVGMGTLSFSAGQNSYAGNIDVQRGTFMAGSLGNGGTIALGMDTTFQALGSFTTSDRDFLINGPCELLVEGADRFLATGTFTGMDDLTKEGTGTFAFRNAEIGYTGTIFVNEGAVEVTTGGSLQSASVTVLPGGTVTGGGLIGPTTINGGDLRGEATHTSVIVNSGLVAPGNSIGTINVIGDYLQAAGAVYEVEIENFASDQIIVGGTATIENGAVLRVLEPMGTLPKGTTYDILLASGGINQVWDVQDLVSGAPFTVVLEEGGTIARLRIDATFILAGRDVGEGNPERVRDYIDEFDLNNDEDLLQVMLLAEKLNDQQLRDALNQMHPAPFGAFPLFNMDMMALVGTTLQRQLITTGLNMHACSDLMMENLPHYFWTAPFGFFSNTKEIDELRGYETAAGGVLAGYDVSILEKHVLFGTFVGYDYTNLQWKQSAGKATIQQLLWGIRGGFAGWDLLCNVSALGGVNFYDTKRHITFPSIERTAKSDHLGGFFTSQIDLLWNAFHFFEVFGSVAYDYLHQQAYDEEGAHSLDLRVFARDDHYVRGEAGGRFNLFFDASYISWRLFSGLSYVRKYPLQNGNYRSKFSDFRTENPLLVVRTFDQNLWALSPEFGIERTGDMLIYGAFYKGELHHDRYANEVVMRLGVNY
ncbi:MAG: autotransporter domain-containing protein, partial [Chlamydiota bacterium]